MEYLQNVSLAHLQLLMNTSAKYQANWTETVGVVRTRFRGQTDHPTGLIPVYPPHPPKLRLWGYNQEKDEWLDK